MNKDKSLFVEFFGDYPIIRVLDFLIENDVFDYSRKDICRNADVSWNTLETFWNSLEERNIVDYTRKVGKASLYKLNTKSPIVEKLIELDNKLMKKSMEKIGIKKEKAKAFV
ncbi:hypothetical protein KKG83_01515 [Candidatus Micrarchaeota archaeon]|nr:hypothetical protein [Candidatus Micrarchaeota archaeon]